MQYKFAKNKKDESMNKLTASDRLLKLYMINGNKKLWE